MLNCLSFMAETYLKYRLSGVPLSSRQLTILLVILTLSPIWKSQKPSPFADYLQKSNLTSLWTKYLNMKLLFQRTQREISSIDHRYWRCIWAGYHCQCLKLPAIPIVEVWSSWEQEEINYIVWILKIISIQV